MRRKERERLDVRLLIEWSLVRVQLGEPLNSVNIFNELTGEYFDPIVGFELISSSAFGSESFCAAMMGVVMKHRFGDVG